MPWLFSQKIIAISMLNTRTYTSCRIQDEKIFLNEELIFEMANESFPKFIKTAYKRLNKSYPKFHKMDRLCKLAYVTCTYLLEQVDFSAAKPEEIAMVFSNRHSTYHTDAKHAASIKEKDNYFPSPNVFVYTLPNILIGELCIKYNIQGESVFFIQDDIDKDMLMDYGSALIQSGDAKICICGWCDYIEDAYLSEIFIINL